MFLVPFQLLLSLALGMLSLGVLGLSLYLLHRGFRALRRNRRVIRETAPDGSPVTTTTPVLATSPAPLSLLALFITPVLLLLWTFTGRYLVLSSRPAGSDEPHASHSQAVQTITRPDGVRLHVESFGPTNAPTLVFTHGWGLDSDEWYYAKRDLSDRYHLVVWDLPGLGQSTRPDNRDYALDTLADDLSAVIDTAGPRVVLVGHSIGGMINLTFCRRFPNRLGHSVAGIIELNTTYTDPVKTTQNAKTDTALQKPVYEPLLHILIPLSPLLRPLNWLAYQNGLAHLQAMSSFAGTETRGQLDFAAQYNYKSSPAVIARGLLGMLHWDATDTLPTVAVPVLLIAGDQDTTTLPQASEQMQKAMPLAHLQVMRPAAHLGVLERNQQYNYEIARFAEQCLK